MKRTSPNGLAARLALHGLTLLAFVRLDTDTKHEICLVLRPSRGLARARCCTLRACRDSGRGTERHHHHREARPAEQSAGLRVLFVWSEQRLLQSVSARR